MKILDVKSLHLYYRTRKGPVKAVDNVSFSIETGETLALVGESGCGKTSIGISILRVLPRNLDTYKGEVYFNGKDIMKLPDEEFRKEIRWKKISMVFQSALNSLNPVITIGEQIIEPLVLNGKEKSEALELAKEALSDVGLHEDTIKRYPHELSGGMKQRVIIAMALILKPPLVILDEPTSSLDLITQANIMNLLKKLKKEYKLTYLFITHDLPLASELADHIAVMYAGRIVELGPSEVILLNPKHPYTTLLIGSVPTLRIDKKELKYIPGTVPSLIDPPSGCRFHPRCPYRFDPCDKEEPKLKEIEKNHYVACFLY